MNGYDPFQRSIQPGLSVPNSPMPGMQPPTQQPVQPTQQDILQDPEALKALLATYGDQLEMSDFEKQMARVQALRDQLPDAEGRQAGRVYVAANPLEHLGKGVADYRMRKREKELQGGVDAARKRVGEKVGQYGAAILGEE